MRNRKQKIRKKWLRGLRWSRDVIFEISNIRYQIFLKRCLFLHERKHTGAAGS
jgi:hypothetical protein